MGFTSIEGIDKEISVRKGFIPVEDTLAHPLSTAYKPVIEVPSKEEAAREAIRIGGVSPALEEPWVDPVSAFTGGFVGAGRMAVGAGVKTLPALGRALLGGGTAVLTEPAIGQSTEYVGEKYPKLAMPYALLVGVLSGATIEKTIENRVIKALSKGGVKPAAKAVEELTAKVKADLVADNIADPITRDVHQELTTFAQKIEQDLGIGRQAKSAQESAEVFKEFVGKLNKPAEKRKVVNQKLREQISSMEEITHKKFRDMNEEEQVNAVFRHKVTGAWNEFAFNEAQKTSPKPVQVSIDANGLKWINDNYGHEAGNELLRKTNETFSKLGVDLYHIGGDEFAIRANTSAEADAIMKRARVALAETPLTVVDKNGETRIFKGMSFGYGKGSTFKEADFDLIRDKEQAITRGERAKERGGRPPSLVEVTEKPSGFTLTAPVAPKAKAPAPRQETLIEVRPEFPKGKIPTKEAGFTMLEEIRAREAEARQTVLGEEPKGKTVRVPKKQKINYETDTLADFVRKSGGLSIEKETGMKGEIRDRFSIKGGYNLVDNKTGRSLDDMGEIAWEAGYFRERPTVAELIDALDEDVRSKQAGKKGAHYSNLKQSWDDIFAEMEEEAYKERGGREGGGDISAGGLRYGAELPKYAASINLERVGADYSVKKLILDVSDQYKGRIDEARRGTITLEETKRLADELGMTPGRLLKRRKGQVFNAEEVTAARNILNTSATDLKRLQAEAVKSNSDEALSRFRMAMDRHAAIQAEVSGASTEAARALSAHRIISKEAKNYKAMLDSLGGRELTEAILDKFSRINPEDQIAVNKFIRDATKAKTTDMIFEAWINALLSSPITHAVNITSNALTFLSKIPEEAMAAGFDFMRSTITRTPRERFFGETPHHIFGLWQGIKEGTRKGLEAFKTEVPSQGLSKLEVTKYQAIPSKVFRAGAEKKRIFGKEIPFTGEIELGGKQVRLAGRGLTAEDEFFKAVNYQAEIQSLAYRKAVTEGLKGEARAKRIAEILADPSSELVGMAQEEMLYRVFQKKLGASGTTLQRYRQVTPGLKYVIPFLRTPINIAKFGLERTPLYYPFILRKMLKGELKGGQVSDELAKATLGSFVAATVAMYAAEGKITGGGPKDKAKREALYRTGWQPYSIEINGNYYAYGRLEPLGTTIGLTADFVELMDTMSDEEREDVATKIALSVSKNITNKTFMSGLSDAINATADPERYGEAWTNRIVSTAVPRIAATTARAIDPTLKEPSTYSEVLKANIPFLSRDVPIKRTLWGEPIEISGTAAERMISPIRRSPVRESKIDNEMVRLGISISMPRPEIRGIELTPDEHDWLVKEAGQWAKKRLDARVNTSSWDKEKDEKKEAIIRETIMAGRDRARGLLFGKIKERLPQRGENK